MLVCAHCGNRDDRHRRITLPDRCNDNSLVIRIAQRVQHDIGVLDEIATPARDGRTALIGVGSVAHADDEARIAEAGEVRDHERGVVRLDHQTEGTNRMRNGSLEHTVIAPPRVVRAVGP